MANLKSAIKRVGVNDKKRTRNQSRRSDMRTNIKHVEKLIEANDFENAESAFKETAKKIDKAVQKGAVHRNNGKREKSRLAKKVNTLRAS